MRVDIEHRLPIVVGMSHEPMRPVSAKDFEPSTNEKAKGYEQVSYDAAEDACNKLMFAYKCFLHSASLYTESGEHYKAQRMHKLAQSMLDAKNSVGG